MRSFIKPRKKKLFDDMTTMWLAFIVLVSIALMVFGGVIYYKSSFYIKMIDSLKENNAKKTYIVNHLKDNISLIQMQASLDKDVKETNRILKQSMKNLFDLIPDQITLTKVVMQKKSLLLCGYTNSIDSYTLLLEPPLKSIFTKSIVKFSQDGKGHTLFESFNTMDVLKDQNVSR